MEQFPLGATKRTETGKGVARRLRRAGRLPGVAYGHGQEAIPLSVDRRELQAVLKSEYGLNTLLALSVDGGAPADLAAIVKGLQVDPATRELLAVDFQWVSLTEEITVSVGVTLTGQAPGVVEGGVMEQALHEVEVSCRPTDIPETISVDISSLRQGDTLHVSNLQAPPGVTILTSLATTVCTVSAPAVVEEEVRKVPAERVVAEGEEGAEEAATPTEEAESESAEE